MARGDIVSSSDSSADHGLGKAIVPIRPQLQGGRYLEKAERAFDAGLYDAAVNYVWDLVINDLRMKVEAYGVEIFLAVEGDLDYKEGAATLSDRWHYVPDSRLLLGCLRLNIIGRTAYRHLSFWLSVRHHESAAHPVEEEEELDGPTAVAFIRDCVKYVLSRDLPAPGFHYGQLISSVKAKDLQPDLPEIIVSLESISEDQADNVVGMFVDAFVGGTSQTKSNVLALIPTAWQRCSAEARENVGQKYAKYSSEGDQERKSEIFALLTHVGGVKYIPTQFRRIMYGKAARELTNAHFDYDNFHKEVSPARQLAELGTSCPDEVLFEFMEAFLVSFMGNRYGRSNGAHTHLVRLKQDFGLRHYQTLLKCVRSSDMVQSEMMGEKPYSNLQDLMTEALPFLVSAKDKEDAEFILNNGGAAALTRFAGDATAS